MTPYRKVKLVENVARMWRREVNTRFWWGNSGEKPFVRPRRRWKYDIKMNLQEVGWGYELH